MNLQCRVGARGCLEAGSQLGGACGSLGCGSAGTGEAVGADEITSSKCWERRPSGLTQQPSDLLIASFSILNPLCDFYGSTSSIHLAVPPQSPLLLLLPDGCVEVFQRVLGPLAFLLFSFFLFLSLSLSALRRLLHAVVLNSISLQMAPQFSPARLTSKHQIHIRLVFQNALLNISS